MTEDLEARVDELEDELEELRSRVEMQGQMLVGLDKLREDIESLKRVIGQLGFIDLQDDPDAGEH